VALSFFRTFNDLCRSWYWVRDDLGTNRQGMSWHGTSPAPLFIYEVGGDLPIQKLKHVKSDEFVHILGRLTYVERPILTLLHCLYLILFLSTHRAEQQRSGLQPSNVFWRFGRKWSFNNWPRALAHSTPNFHRVNSKVRNLALFSTPLNFELPVFESATRYLNTETNIC